MRIDKWLYYTRFYKTRGLASSAVGGGHVKLNGARARPSAEVRPGDVIDIVRNQMPWRLEAGPLPVRRGPAREAAACYREDAEVAAERGRRIEARKFDRLQMPRTDGRPDKRTRRKLRDRRRPLQ